MNELKITHCEHSGGGEYIAKASGSMHCGRLEWEFDESGAHVATHTLVPPQIGGKGIAAKLVAAMIADARSLGFKINPQCSYVAARFDRNPAWSDLRA
ncbi:GNAT family N-acetyltransferase [Erythrobacter sp. W53]|uniref:GNAT family N-acetyltransferase n=1 Tax=Erythrobacteraceae TaxID=335929 RepID=UPI0036D353A7